VDNELATHDTIRYEMLVSQLCIPHVRKEKEKKLLCSFKTRICETTVSISTKFCTTMQTIKRSLWVVQIGAQQIQDGGRQPFKKIVKSPYLCNRLSDFD